MGRSSRGVTVVDVLVVCTCSVLFLVTASVVVGQAQVGNDAAGARHRLSIKDAEQLKQIHAAMVAFAETHKGRYPTPGLINRKAADLDGDGKGDAEIPDVGPEDIALNTTANLYSALIAMHYVPLELVISPVDRNPNVKVDADYNNAAYSPANDSFWDAGFKAAPMEESNTSYAHLALHSQRKRRMWRHEVGGVWPVLSNRGPKDGKPNPKSYTCGPHGNWSGHVIYTDNHVEFHHATKPKGVSFIVNDHPQQDNLFAFDNGLAGIDTILTFTKQMTEEGPVIQYD